jgi:hypothetical protein
MIMPNLQPLVKQQQPTASPPAQQRVAAGGAQQQTTGAQGAGAQRSAVDVEAGAQEFEAKIAASVAAEQRSMALRLVMLTQAPYSPELDTGLVGYLKASSTCGHASHTDTLLVLTFVQVP